MINSLLLSSVLEKRLIRSIFDELADVLLAIDTVYKTVYWNRLMFRAPVMASSTQRESLI